MSITFSSVHLAGILFPQRWFDWAHHTELVEVESIEVKIFANYLCPIVRKGLCVNAIILGTNAA
jgi:hypothetical protein